MSATEPLSHSRLAHATMLASLDLTIPFYPLIGLDRGGEFPWRDLTRDFIRERREDPPEEAPASFERTLAVFTRIEKEAGPAASRVFRWWCEEVYCESHKERPALYTWKWIFRGARKTANDWNALELPDALRKEAKERFQQSTDSDAFDALSESVASQALSDWDLHLHAINEWNDDLPDAPNGPLSQLYTIQSTYRSLDYWTWLLDRLSSEELETVEAAGQRFVEATEDLRFLGQVPPLSELRLETP